MREMGLGRAGTGKGEITLADARDRAGDLVKLVRGGTDLVIQREEEAKAKAQKAAMMAITFTQVSEKFMNVHGAGRGDVTPHGFRSSFSDWAADRVVRPAIGEEASREVDEALFESSLVTTMLTIHPSGTAVSIGLGWPCVVSRSRAIRQAPRQGDHVLRLGGYRR